VGNMRPGTLVRLPAASGNGGPSAVSPVATAASGPAATR
jgi:hypothetical protein